MSKVSKYELAKMYYEDGHTQGDIASKLGVTSRTVCRWMSDYGIAPGRSVVQDVTRMRKQHSAASLYLDSSGYESVISHSDGEKNGCRLHQLVAIASGADPHNVFSGGEYNVHHKNGVKWDNRPENLELMTQTEHQKEHSDTIPWITALRVLEMYASTEASQGLIGEQFGIDGSTVSRIVNGKHKHTNGQGACVESGRGVSACGD